MGMSLAFLTVGLVPAQLFWLACVVMFIGETMNAFTDGTHMLGRVFSLLSSLDQVVTLFGFLLVAPLTDWIGVRFMFIGAGACAVLITQSLFWVPVIHSIEEQTLDFEEEPVPAAVASAAL